LFHFPDPQPLPPHQQLLRPSLSSGFETDRLRTFLKLSIFRTSVGAKMLSLFPPDFPVLVSVPRLHSISMSVGTMPLVCSGKKLNAWRRRRTHHGVLPAGTGGCAENAHPALFAVLLRMPGGAPTGRLPG
jgi:hypothetical protein